MWVEQVKLVFLGVTYALLIRRFLKLEYVRAVFEINQFCKHLVCWLIIWCALSKQTLFWVRESWFKCKLNHYQEITRATRVWHAKHVKHRLKSSLKGKFGPQKCPYLQVLRGLFRVRKKWLVLFCMFNASLIAYSAQETLCFLHILSLFLHAHRSDNKYLNFKTLTELAKVSLNSKIQFHLVLYIIAHIY